MALTFLKNEEIKYFEIWENTPRLPESIRKSLVGLNAEEKLKAVVEHYLKVEDVGNLCRAMSAIGFSPIDPLNGIHRNGKLVVFEGIRRLIAAQILLNPDLIKDVKYMVRDDEDTEPLQAYEVIKRYRANMSDKLVDTLRKLPIIEFNSHMYSLESASTEVITSSVDFSDDLVCPDCGRSEFCEGETECGDCGHIF